MKEKQHETPACAHYVSKYLPITENWIYRTIINHQAYHPLFFARKKTNINLFPIDRLFSLDDFGTVRRYAEILFFKIFGYFNFIKTICCLNKVSILHVHFGYHGAKMIGLKKRLGVPMLCSFYGDDAFADQHTKKYDHLFREADKILVLGAYMKSALIRIGCPAKKIIIHHLGIDVTNIKFTQRKITKGQKIRFLMASSFVPKKGIDHAILALSQFKDESFSLDIVGDGPQKSEILKIIEESGIKDRITLHGYKPYEHFINLAYACDVFMLASRTTEQNNKEGTPMALVDAMATGMMILSTKHSDIPEIVIDGENGYLAEENDIESLKDCIRKTFLAPDQIGTFGLKGRARAEQEFNAKTQTLKLEEYYTALLRSEN